MTERSGAAPLPGPDSALIAYGSAQGSTGRVAEAIAEGLTAGGVRASAIRLDRLSLVPSRVASADIFALGTPVYYLREPTYVASFVNDLPSLDGKKAFVFCTTGMNRIGETLERLRDALASRGAEVVGAESFPSAMAYPPYRERGFGNPEGLPDDAVLASARDFGARMARAGDLAPASLPRATYATRVKAGLLATPALRKALLPKIRLDPDICTGYGSCISRCFFEALDREGEEDKPTVNDACVQCLQCVASCPRAAIVVDSGFKASLSAVIYRLGLH